VIDLTSLRTCVRWLTFVYLALPLALFLMGFLKFWLGLALSLGLIGACFSTLGRWHRPPAEIAPPPLPISTSKLSIALLILLALLGTTGAGGIGPESSDWAKHNAILKDLIDQPWPVGYAIRGESANLVYYVAYYLPAALVGKAAGWEIANLALFCWSFIGAALALIWVCLLSRGRVWVCSAVFLLFSGMDVAGALTGGGSWRDIAAVFANPDLEWWSGLWQYSSNVSLLYYVPHQAIGGWLLASLALDGVESRGGPAPALLLLGLSLLWSPLVTFGLIPLLAANLICDNGLSLQFRGRRLPANLVGLGLVAVLSLYFHTRTFSVTLPENIFAAGVDMNRGRFYVLATGWPFLDFAWRYVRFIPCEFALLAMAIWAAMRNTPRFRVLKPAFVAAVAALTILPFFRYGVFNDLVMRASIPSLFVLQILAIVALNAEKRTRATLMVWLVLAVGAVHSANLIRMHAATMMERRTLVFAPERSAVKDLFSIQSGIETWDFVDQYLGSGDTWFTRCCMAKVDRRLIRPVQDHPEPGHAEN